VTNYRGDFLCGHRQTKVIFSCGTAITWEIKVNSRSCGENSWGSLRGLGENCARIFVSGGVLAGRRNCDALIEGLCVFCSFWSVFRFDEVFLRSKRVSCSQACRPGAVASTGEEENDCGNFF
jgi:hypothetical protein